MIAHPKLTSVAVYETVAPVTVDGSLQLSASRTTGDDPAGRQYYEKRIRAKWSEETQRNAVAVALSSAYFA